MTNFWSALTTTSTAVGLLSALLTTDAPAIAQPNSPSTTQSAAVRTTPVKVPEILSGPPNTTLPVHRSSGNCPSTIRLWTASRYYEGGAENTVIMNMSAIASAPAKFMDVRDRVVIYGAPLQKTYASCVGWVVAPNAPEYNIWLQFGNAYFRFDLDVLKGRPLSEITYQNVVKGQPYLRWAIAD
ncbi:MULTISPECIES: hypothetical protein [Trichocoleus]|uniref:Uncharacterized protein n=1 Tax=Trichocoleus desertorum GB2-A4 TaxID=2933944 RepID=A0ABV0JBR3_9CYAN|nr:hypothetical protein [Trichocoleus sp. FACHB-46]MBD1862864.1 hypothetical protein [Trichocoleus sp. FACHB-46]